MNTYVVLLEDVYCKVEANNIIEAIYEFYVYEHCENEIVRKAILAMSNTKEAMTLYNKLCNKYDDYIRYIFHIEDNYIK